jgi:hypothetical protein
LKPNALGKLALWFAPARNYANVFAMEVLPEDFTARLEGYIINQQNGSDFLRTRWRVSQNRRQWF